jgi:hypothetical protein|tara:strand:- start:547 stop:762 length:216 start_codon:yes stop_codon:yes gene_type:complete
MTKVYWSKAVEILCGDDDSLYLEAADGEKYDLEEFMRSDGEYDAIMGLTNTSALALTLMSDGETGILHCIG